MFRVSICYPEPSDRFAFDQHYATVHVPIVRTVPGLASFTAGRCRPLDSGSASSFYMIAELGFDTAQTLAAAMKSSEMHSAGKDLDNFTAGVTMYTTEDIAFD